MTHPFHVRQEPDVVAGRRIGVIGVVAVLICVVSLVVVTRFGAWPRSAAVRSRPPAAPAHIGMTEQTPIARTERGLALRAAQRERLEHYGWIDRDAGIAYIPIDRAMDVVVGEGERANEKSYTGPAGDVRGAQ
jgi:hypothetical protein